MAGHFLKREQDRTIWRTYYLTLYREIQLPACCAMEAMEQAKELLDGQDDDVQWRLDYHDEIRTA